ncbi:hypothetical protein I79_013490 [Cricetulus griseus]|uniref:Uncharacterized protein n=1 Tax=Cricetulus griseus TaxID=10029 RepID=G3HRP4_CRIGR|nr:hypothetical protein I79_013490 [Cricetulus griseus]
MLYCLFSEKGLRYTPVVPPLPQNSCLSLCGTQTSVPHFLRWTHCKPLGNC